jgi:hypothetical protein
MNPQWANLRPASLGLSWGLSLAACLRIVHIEPLEIAESYFRIPYALTEPDQQLILYFDSQDRLMRMTVEIWRSHQWDQKIDLTDLELAQLFRSCETRYSECRTSIASVFGSPVFSGAFGDPGYFETDCGSDHVTIWQWQDDRFRLESVFVERNDPLTVTFSCEPVHQ